MSNCYLSSSLFRNMDLKSAITNCGNLSNKYVELSAPHPYQPKNEIIDMFNDFKKKGFNFSLHNYFPPPKKSFVLNVAAEDEQTINSCRDMVNLALELTESSGSKIYGVHAGYLSKAVAKEDGMFEFDEEMYSYSKALDRAVKFINEIAENFKKKNKILIIENLFPSVARESSLFCNIKQIEDLMSQVPKEVGLLLDLGHLNISSNLMKFNREDFLDKYLEKYGNKLHEVHISENNGVKDEHLALIKNSWQLNAINKINKISKNTNKISEIIFCLESRNASNAEISKNISEINHILAG